MNLETKVIAALCQNKDTGILFTSNIEDLFTTHADVFQGIVQHYYKYKEIPDYNEIQAKFGELDDFTPKSPTQYYVDELRNHYIRTRLQNLMLDKSSLLGEKSAVEVMEELYLGLEKLNKQTNAVRDLDLRDYESAANYLAEQKRKSDLMGGTPGIPTGFKAVDAAYATGMAPGHLMVLIGWPGRGKTWFSSYLAMKAWDNGFSPMIISLEMSPEGMRDRIYTLMGSGLFRNSDLSRGAIDLDSFRKWGKDRMDNKQRFTVISNEGQSGVTPNIIQGKIDQYRPDLVICDYHQLLDDNSHSGGEVERNRRVSRELKLLAVHNNLPVIDITAATADDISDHDEPPLLSQVAWSKAIEYDADIAMAIHRAQDSNLIEVVSRKNRHGADFAFYLDWDIDRGVISEVYAT